MKFIATNELGRLAKWLRILGYDSSFYSQDNISTLVITALREDRVVVTRNARISRFPGPRIVQIKSEFVRQQMKQLMDELKLKPKAKDMFTRCVICNVGLNNMAKVKIKSKVPQYVYQSQVGFKSCPSCKKVYWQGTHWGNARKFLAKI